MWQCDNVVNPKSCCLSHCDNFEHIVTLSLSGIKLATVLANFEGPNLAGGRRVGCEWGVDKGIRSWQAHRWGGKGEFFWMIWAPLLLQRFGHQPDSSIYCICILPFLSVYRTVCCCIWLHRVLSVYCTDCLLLYLFSSCSVLVPYCLLPVLSMYRTVCCCICFLPVLSMYRILSAVVFVYFLFCPCTVLSAVVLVYFLFCPCTLYSTVCCCFCLLPVHVPYTTRLSK